MGSDLHMFRTQLEHERWATRRLLDALREAERSHPADARLQRAIDKLGHNLAARDVWLHRMGGRAEPPAAVFPTGVTLEAASAWAEETLGAWSAWLAGLGPGALDRAFTYRSTEGSSWTNTIAEALVHAYSHGFHHRGQIASLLNALGVTPPAIDFIFFVRERAPG